jgi:FtsZ-interacting cell division protein YlmF
MGVPRLSASTPTVRLIAPVAVGDDCGQMVVMRPECLSQVTDVVRVLAGSAPVVIDLDPLDPLSGRRAFDVVSGIAYAFDATITRIDCDRLQFVVTPYATH